MRYGGCIFFICFSVTGFAQAPLPPVGQWREHLPYGSAIDVTAGDNKIYCATPYSVFSVNTTDNTIERLSRITGLNETGISAIQYDGVNKKLFIAYDNSNIDILFRNDIYNIPDIKRDNIVGDKRINAAYPSGKNFYLSSGLGIIVVDGERYEISDTWFIGTGGSQVKVNGFCSDGQFYYAATEEGLKKAPVNSPGLADYANWQMVSGTNGLPAGNCKNVITIRDRVVVEKNDSLFVQGGTNWTLFYTDGWPFVSSNVTESKIQVCQRSLNGISRVIVLNPDATVFSMVTGINAAANPRRAILYNNNIWLADQQEGLSRVTALSSVEKYIPNSPQAVATGEILVYNSVFYAAAGAVNSNWNNQNNRNGFFEFRDGSWDNINVYRFPQFDSLQDLISLVIDKRDESVWTGSYGGGLLHRKPGQVFEIFKQNFLGTAAGNPSAYRVSGLSFDADNNLWISNYGAAEPLRVRKADGSWKSFAVPFPLVDQALAQLIIDNNNYKWIVAPRGNGLLCYDHAGTIENTGDDRWRRFSSGAGNGNLPVNTVFCVAKDKAGFIWVGTADGIGVIQCPELAFGAQVCDAIWPIVPAGNFAGYLFKGQEVRSIAVDGADRKWVATGKGAFLIDAAGEKVIYEFTTDNSPLLSNDVKSITIDGKTGEVYFATAKGICSFRSSATEGTAANENVLVFPNPVPPGFSGTIAIRGLVNNAFVKITEMDGRLVHQTRALGGQAVWDGRNYRGQKISSGVYLVLVSDDGKKERTAAKIFFIQR